MCSHQYAVTPRDAQVTPDGGRPSMPKEAILASPVRKNLRKKSRFPR